MKSCGYFYISIVELKYVAFVLEVLYMIEFLKIVLFVIEGVIEIKVIVKEWG